MEQEFLVRFPKRCSIELLKKDELYILKISNYDETFELHMSRKELLTLAGLFNTME